MYPRAQGGPGAGIPSEFLGITLAGNWWVLVVVLASLVLYLAGTLVIIPLRLTRRRRQRHEALESALAQGSIITELAAALQDRVVNRFRAAELALLTLIIILMVTKPF